MTNLRDDVGERAADTAADPDLSGGEPGSLWNRHTPAPWNNSTLMVSPRLPKKTNSAPCDDAAPAPAPYASRACDAASQCFACSPRHGRHPRIQVRAHVQMRSDQTRPVPLATMVDKPSDDVALRAVAALSERPGGMHAVLDWLRTMPSFREAMLVCTAEADDALRVLLLSALHPDTPKRVWQNLGLDPDIGDRALSPFGARINGFGSPN